ncbi:MAG: Uncharacterized protein FD138_891 [Planctomycetota bacterium]|nr:MAG: Uncharacterized protein FD138_891 [Planctomycetota bacterium]
MMPLNDDILDDLFHGCAFVAFVEQAALTGGSPCPEATRRLAYRYYEEALAHRNRPYPCADDAAVKFKSL